MSARTLPAATAARRPASYDRPVAAASLLLFAAIGVAVRFGWTQPLDGRLLGIVREAGGVGLRSAVIALTSLGSAPVLLAVLAGAAVLLVVRAMAWRAAWLLSVVLGGRLIVELAKDLVERPRPPLAVSGVVAHGWSFPSAHAGNTTITCLALAVAFAATASPAARRAIFALAAATAIAVGSTRLWLAVHWPSDVLAGWLFGLGWVTLWTGRLRAP